MKSRTKNICVGLLACACVSAAVGATVYSFRQTDGGYNSLSPQLKGDYFGGLTAFADGEIQVTPEELSEGTATFTPSMKGIISKNYDYLLVMANIDDVSKYAEVGFSYALGDGEVVSYMSNHYYDAIRFASGNLVPMTQIFGETCKGMIVYEFHYNPLEDTKITPVLTLEESVEHEVPAYSTGTVSKNDNVLYNGNFETGNLTGWTPNGGEIVHVTSASTDFDNREYGKKGNYLIAGTEDAIDEVKQGNGLEGNIGTLVSSDFVIGGSGWITFRLGGGGNSECYVLVKDSEGNILGKFHNTVTPNAGTLTLYKADLSEHIGKTAHIEIVDNADSVWGCLTADNFITYYETTGDLPETAVEATNYLYQVLNGGFETANLGNYLNGWTLNGGEFVHVTSASTDFANREYGKEGNYLIAGTEDMIDGELQENGLEGNKGTLVSSDFVIGGSGWITFRLGGGGNSECYVLVKDSEGNILGKFHNTVTPNAGTLTLYKADLSEHIGKTAHIEIVDNADSVWGCLTADNFITYYKAIGDLPETAVEATNYLYQVLNGGFETANLGNYLNGWTLSGEIGYITEDAYFWTDKAINNSAHYFRGDGVEGNTGTLTSSDFVVGGSGWITFKMGAAKPPACYITLQVKNDDGTYSTVAIWYNDQFADGDENIDKPGYGLRLVQYKADLNKYLGKTVRVVLHDEATAGFGFFTFDELITYYKTTDDLPADSINVSVLGYSVFNGGFETGDLTGWKLAETNKAENTTQNNIGYVSSMSYYWHDANKLYNKEGNYLFSGIEDTRLENGTPATYEGNQGTLTSSKFILGGSGWITFRLAGGGNENCNILIKDEAGNTVAKYHNTVTGDSGVLTLFKANLSDYLGKMLYIVVEDNASGGWGCMAVDDFVTYYESEPVDGTVAVNILT